MRLIYKNLKLPKHAVLISHNDQYHLLHYDTEILTIDQQNLRIIQAKKCTVDSYKAQYAVIDYLEMSRDHFKDYMDDQEPFRDFIKYEVGQY